MTGEGITVHPRWEPTTVEGLLRLVADVDRPTGRDAPALFLAACEADARSHGGCVSVNRVRALLELVGADIPPRRYSAMWAVYTGDGRPMLKLPEWEVCSGSRSGNDGRPMPLRKWVGRRADEARADAPHDG